MDNNFQSLYQKYRPQNFSEVKGQKTIIDNLQKSINEKRPAHAYIFSGSRGTGKTSLARIFAKELKTDPADLYEIDAATYTGVDRIREIIDGVKTLPALSEFKVYIIDEVHMLSKSAFNALLKTLEEPPKHAIFILATTELEKIPNTIISRCQMYRFENPSQKILTDFVTEIAKKEKYEIQEEASLLIALLGNGSFRDSLSILQKIMLSSDNKKITAEMVTEQSGTPTKKLVLDFLTEIQEKNTAKALAIIKELENQNRDPVLFLTLVSEQLRILLNYRFTKNKDLIKSEIESSWLEKYRGQEGNNLNSIMLLEFLDLLLSLEQTILKYTYLEAVTIKITQEDKK